MKRFFLDETNDFAPTDALVDAVDESIDMVFLCQPNNPTGQLASPELVKKLLRRCGECHTILAVDECFLDFLPDADGWTAKASAGKWGSRHPESFHQALRHGRRPAGLLPLQRRNASGKMQTAGQPWAVSSLAQAAGVAALKNRLCGRGARPYRPAEPVLTAGLRALGLRVIDGRANYLLFHAPADLNERLRPLGTQVRSCANYPGLGPEWYHTAVRTAPRTPGCWNYERGAGMSRAKCIMVQGTMSGAGKVCSARRSAAFLRRTACAPCRSRARTWL